MAGCSLGDTLGVSWKLCQYTDPIEAVHSNLRPTMTYLGFTLNVSPKAEVSSLWAPTDSTLGLYSINSPTNYKEEILKKITQSHIWGSQSYLRKHAHSSVSSWAWRQSSFALHALLFIKGRIVFIATVISAVGVYLEKGAPRSIWNSQISLSLRHGNCSSVVLQSKQSIICL